MGRLVALVLLASLFSAGCSTSDAELARRERKAIRKRVDDSLVLTPYRGLKLTIRSRGGVQVPEALAALQALLGKADATTAGERMSALEVAKFVIAVHGLKKQIAAIDEDSLPTVWEAYFGAPPKFGFPYDSAAEHLYLSALWMALDAGAKVPAGAGGDLVLYEIDRAVPGSAWDAHMRALAQLARGTVFCREGFHYAADEELTAYLASIDQLGDVAILFGPAALEESRAAGLFVRAWNREVLGRKEASTKDLDAGLAALEKAGIENELTLWARALVAYRQHKPADAADALDKLAESPNLDDETRAELKVCAEGLRKNGAEPSLFSHQRASLLLARALIARAGGLEAVLCKLSGEERGHQLFARLTRVDQLRQALSVPNAIDEAKSLGGTAVDGAKAAGGKAVDFLKSKVDALKK